MINSAVAVPVHKVELRYPPTWGMWFSCWRFTLTCLITCEEEEVNRHWNVNIIRKTGPDPVLHLFLSSSSSRLHSNTLVCSALPLVGKGILHFSGACFFNLSSSTLVCILQGKGNGRDGHLGGAFLWRGRSLGCGAGGWGGRALQRAQSFAEPRVLGCLDLVHQDSPLVLKLLQRNETNRRFKKKHSNRQ